MVQTLKCKGPFRTGGTMKTLGNMEHNTEGDKKKI